MMKMAKFSNIICFTQAVFAAVLFLHVYIYRRAYENALFISLFSSVINSPNINRQQINLRCTLFSPRFRSLLSLLDTVHSTIELIFKDSSALTHNNCLTKSNCHSAWNSFKMLFGWKFLNSKFALWNFGQKKLFKNSFEPNLAEFGTRFLSNQNSKKKSTFILKLIVRYSYLSLAAFAGYLCVPRHIPLFLGYSRNGEILTNANAVPTNP